jgi:hypothetical protein
MRQAPTLMAKINGWLPAGVIRNLEPGISGLLWTVSSDTHSLARDPVYFSTTLRDLCRRDG